MPAWPRVLVLAALFSSSVAAVGACVGDASAPSPAQQGALGGPCYANGTCNKGLSCVVVGASAQCEAEDGGPLKDSAADQSATDSAGDAPVDTGVDASCPAPMALSLLCGGGMPPVACYDTVTSGASCALTLADCQNQYPNAFAATCTNGAQCGGSGMHCCVPDAVAQVSGCMGTLALMPLTSATCVASCGSGNVELCTKSSECTTPGQRCVPVVISGGGGPVALLGQIVGVCSN